MSNWEIQSTYAEDVDLSGKEIFEYGTTKLVVEMKAAGEPLVVKAEARVMKAPHAERGYTFIIKDYSVLDGEYLMQTGMTHKHEVKLVRGLLDKFVKVEL